MSKVSSRLRELHRAALTSVPDHKIARPKAHPHAVERTQLLAQVFDDVESRVVVLQGPAGHGKTSLMLQALEACKSRDVLTGWLSLDESDNDMPRFLGHIQGLVGALRAEAGHPFRGTLPQDSAGTNARTDWLVSGLLALGRPLAIFIDDLHFVSSRSVLGLLRELLAEAPSNIRWFISSRAVPEIGLPRLVVGNHALVIRAEQLRFSEQEVARFFEDAGAVDASADEISAIHHITEGWPAAVQLYRLALDNPSIRQSLTQRRVHQLPDLAGYLVDNVLSLQDKGVQDFLFKTSLLHRMSAPLCDAILGRTDSRSMLAYLERTGLFVRRIESDEQWFTYHALFSRFLQDHLRDLHLDSVQDLHRKAGVWFREHGHFEEALYHFSAAGDHSDAADVFETWAERLVPYGHMVTVDRWSDSIPMLELEKRPGLVIKIVWALAFLSRHNKLEPLLKLLRAIPPTKYANGDPRVVLCMVAILKDDIASIPRYVDGIDTDTPSPSRFQTFELGTVCNARGYHAMTAGRYAEALRHLARGRALSEAADAAFAWAYSIVKATLTQVSQGELQEALTQFRLALADPRMQADDSVSAACLACGHIMALYEINELDLALRRFEQSRELIIDAGIHDYLVIAYRSVARIHDLKGNPEEALLMLAEAEKLAYQGRWPRAVRLIDWERVRRKVLMGHLDRASSIASRFDSEIELADTEWVRLSEDIEDSIIGTIRLSLHAGDARAALRLIRPCLRQATLDKRVHRQIKLLTLAALAHRVEENRAQAHSNLEEALALAAPGGYVRTILDEGEQVTQLLLEHLNSQLDRSARRFERSTDAFLARLIGIVMPESAARLESRSTSAVAAVPASIKGFSDKEKKIMSMLVSCLSNDQIASSMFVTRETVRYHLKNIYSKLGVKSRLEAIRLLRGS